MLKLNSLIIELKNNERINSTKRELDVAIATPITPSLGAPNHPKIKTAFNEMFKRIAVIVINVTVFTRSMLLIID